MTDHGVAANQPPQILRAAIDRIALETAAVQLKPGERGAIVGVVTDRGVNLVVVTQPHGQLEVQGYIGKTWGAPLEGGASVRWSW